MGYGLSSYSEKFYKNNPEIEKRIKDLFSLHNEKYIRMMILISFLKNLNKNEFCNFSIRCY